MRKPGWNWLQFYPFSAWLAGTIGRTAIQARCVLGEVFLTSWSLQRRGWGETWEAGGNQPGSLPYSEVSLTANVWTFSIPVPRIAAPWPPAMGNAELWLCSLACVLLQMQSRKASMERELGLGHLQGAAWAGRKTGVFGLVVKILDCIKPAPNLTWRKENTPRPKAAFPNTYLTAACRVTCRSQQYKTEAMIWTLRHVNKNYY